MALGTDGVVVMTLDETASFLRCHRSTIYRLMKSDPKFPYFRLGSDYRFIRNDVEAWMRGQSGDASD